MGCRGSQGADNLPQAPAAAGGGHQETGSSLQAWAEAADGRRLAVVEELREKLAWNQGRGHQEGGEEARASLAEHWGVQETGWADPGEMGASGLRESGRFDVGAACWV